MPLSSTARLFVAPSAVLGLTVAALGLWATSLPLETASIAPGIVKATGDRLTVQAALDGEIAEVLVGEGAEVETGQVLLRYDAVERRAAFDRLVGRYLMALASRSRAVAELGLRDTLPETKPTIGAQDRRWHAAQKTQAALLRTSISDLRRHHVDIDRQIADGQMQLEALVSERRAVEQQLALARDAQERLSALERKKIATRTSVSEAHGRRAAFEARLAQLDGERAEIRRSLSALSSRKQERAAQVRDSAGRALEAAEASLFDLEQELARAGADLRRLEVRAPTAGRVFQLSVRHAGAVVRTGTVLAEIVPTQGQPAILAKLDPRDVDSVAPGDRARVRLTGQTLGVHCRCKGLCGGSHRMPLQIRPAGATTKSRLPWLTGLKFG